MRFFLFKIKHTYRHTVFDRAGPAEYCNLISAAVDLP